MKYIYLILFGLLLTPTVGSAQQGMVDARGNPEEIVPEAFPPSPSDKVLGPATLPRLMLGLFAGVISTSHTGSFSMRQDGILCCEFDGATALRPTIALRGDYFPNQKGFWGVSARVAWEDHSAEFESDVDQLLIFGDDNEPEKADFQNRLDASMTGFSFTPMVMLKLINLDLYFSAGPSLTFYSSPQFNKTEHILGPEGVTYLDGTTEVTFLDVPVEGVNSSTFSVAAGLDLRYPVSENIYLGSELHYRLPLTKITADEEWKASHIIATIGASISL